jgi:hypothetical protein
MIDRGCNIIYTSNKLSFYNCYPDLPTPNLSYLGVENYIAADGSERTRYRIEITNSGDFPNELFEPAPYLPPCGSNTNSSRTWVKIYDKNGKYLYGFCGLPSSEHLNRIWFSVPKGTPPPAEVYIEMIDRDCNIIYTSNIISFKFPHGDLDYDGIVGSNDRSIFLGAFGTNIGDTSYIEGADYDEDGDIDFLDYRSWLFYYGIYQKDRLIQLKHSYFGGAP